jgi:hypothetical protein
MEVIASPPGRSRRLSAFAAAAFAGIVAASAGALLAPSDGADRRSPAPLTRSASNSTLELRFPADWRRLPKAPRLPGVELEEPLAVGPRGSEGKLAVGMVDAEGPSLLPASARLARPVPHPAAVRIGDLQALRYRDLSLKGLDRRVTLYAAPTNAGVATMACLGGREAGARFASECERVASTLGLLTGRGFPLGPSDRYARAVKVAFDRVASAQKRHGSRLRSARTAASQARAARGLRKGYLTLARKLSRIEISPADAEANEAVARATRRVGVAYGGLSQAARRGDRGAYSTAAGRVRSEARRLDDAISTLKALGYRVR